MPKGKSKSRKQQANRQGMTLAGANHLPFGQWTVAECPDFMPLRFKYTAFIQSVSIGNEGLYKFRLNSLFDPDLTGTGGQPAGFDQWKLLYSEYRVMAVDVDIRAHTQTAGNSALVVLVPTYDTSFSDGAQDAASMRRAVSAFATQQEPARLRATYRMSDLLGFTDQTILSDPNVTASVSANPATLFIGNVATRTSGATDTIEFYVCITFYARMERVFPPSDLWKRFSLSSSPEQADGCSRCSVLATDSVPPPLRAAATTTAPDKCLASDNNATGKKTGNSSHGSVIAAVNTNNAATAGNCTHNPPCWEQALRV